jgi:hypothetical protein
MILRVSALFLPSLLLCSAFPPPCRSRPGFARYAEKDNAGNDLVESLGKAAMQVGADFFVALRWGAANALTAALPENQRKVLLERMDPEPPKAANAKKNDDDDGEEIVMKNSVNEAVAAAVAVESQREAKRWEREKEQIMAQAEEAAKKRVETDLAIQKQRLEQEQRQYREQAEAAKLELELEKKALDENAQMERQAQEEAFKKELEAKEAELRETLEKEMAIGGSVADTSGYNDLDVHPILGPALQDLGYKRLHLVSADKLATIPVWKKQRIYRHDRAKAMAADKLKTLHLGLPGVICLHEEENGKLAILDGQHRVGMMKILQEKQHEQQQPKTTTTAANEATSVADYIDLDHILVEVYPQTPQIRSTDHAQDIFLEINKAEPIKLVDMPGVATAKDRNLISQAVNRLQNEYPAMFSPSQRCRAPNVNVDNLRDNLFAANVIKRHNLKTATQLLDWMLAQNELVAGKYENDVTAQSTNFSPKAWSKASSNKFYLGLESSWLYN